MNTEKEIENYANIKEVAEVNLLTYLEIELRGEFLETDMAFETFVAHVNINVLLQVNQLCKASFTMRIWTNKGKLLGVGQHVIEEVMPFPEHSVTVGVGALHEPRNSLSVVHLPYFINEELIGVGCELGNANIVEIKVFARHHKHL